MVAFEPTRSSSSLSDGSPPFPLLALADYSHNNIVIANALTGAVLRLISHEGYGFGEIKSPIGICADPSGTELFVSESYNNRISVFKVDTGDFLRCFRFDKLKDPRGVIFYDDLLWVCNSGTGSVLLLNPKNGDEKEELQGILPDTKNNLFHTPQGIAVSKELCFVTDFGNRNIFVFDLKTRKCVTRFGAKSLGAPKMVAVYQNDAGKIKTGKDIMQVLVTDTYSSFIIKFEFSRDT